MPAIETFPLGGMALVRASGGNAVAVVDGRARDILEGLGRGANETELAHRHSAAAGGLAQASSQIAALKRLWAELAARSATAAPADVGAAEDRPPALDAVCRLGDRPVRLQIWPRTLARVLAEVTRPCHASTGDAGEATLVVRRVAGRYRLTVDGSPALATRDLMLARSEVLRLLVLAAHPGRRWLAVLHGAAVVGPRGAALLCGASGSGKSTLTGMLVSGGLALATDDYAPIEAGSRAVWPVRFGMSVKEGSWPLLAPQFPALAKAPVIRTRGRRQRYVKPPNWAAGPAPVRCLVFPLYGAGEPLALLRLAPEEALALLARSGGWYESSRERLAELTRWIGEVPAYALSYGDGAAAVAAVRRLLAGDA